MPKDYKNQEIQEDKPLTWTTQADVEVHSSEWIGSIIRYFWHLGKREFNTLYIPKELKKNVIIGWFFKVILLVVLIYLGFIFINSNFK